jgi:hypothetical protein
MNIIFDSNFSNNHNLSNKFIKKKSVSNNNKNFDEG